MIPPPAGSSRQDPPAGWQARNVEPCLPPASPGGFATVWTDKSVLFAMHVPMALMPCPRPRFTHGTARTYMPSHYVDWMGAVRTLVRIEFAHAKIPNRITPCHTHFVVRQIRGKVDGDNLLKAGNDCLSGIVIPDDSIRHVRATSIVYDPDPKGGFEVFIYEA